MKKILEIGNFPPPYCGWAIQMKFLVDELRQRGHACDILKINENRQIRSPEYVDVQNALDYLQKILRFAARGYQFHAHVNAESPKGYLLALTAAIIGRLFGRAPVVTFHGGLPQKFFPRARGVSRTAFQLLFRTFDRILCNSVEIKQAIAAYGICPAKIDAIPGFSPRYLRYTPVPLPAEAAKFLGQRRPVFFCYVSLRPEYHLDLLAATIERVVTRHGDAGFIWLGFPEKELSAARTYAASLPTTVQQSVLLLGNLGHDEFVTLLLRCTAMLRTAGCDGVSASVLESLALNVPVIAAENGRRPAGVVTYAETDVDDCAAKVEYVLANYTAIKAQTKVDATQDNVALTADWLLKENTRALHATVLGARR
jgi:glycosyltransferase involved in cell wall biosynthesis